MKTQESYLGKVAILIPSLNPEEYMVRFVVGLSEAGFQNIILVNDGSSNETQSFFDEVQKLDGVVVLKHAVNQGKGRALKTGFHYFLNTYKAGEMDGIVTADADGQHSVEDTCKVAEILSQTGKCVLGTRDFDQQDVPFKSKFGNKLTTFFFTLLYGKKITDTQTGLRGIPYSFIEQCLKISGERFDYEIAMLIDLVRHKVNIVEEPIKTIYIESNRATHFNAVKDSIRIYRILLGTFLKFAASSLLSAVIDIGLFAVFTKYVFKFMNMEMATFLGAALARIISSLINFYTNKNVVFANREKYGKTMIRYYCLCCVQLICSWALVILAYNQLHWDTTIIKALMDTILYFISYQIQRCWVYK